MLQLIPWKFLLFCGGTLLLVVVVSMAVFGFLGIPMTGSQLFPKGLLYFVFSGWC